MTTHNETNRSFLLVDSDSCPIGVPNDCSLVPLDRQIISISQRNLLTKVLPESLERTAQLTETDCHTKFLSVMFDLRDGVKNPDHQKIWVDLIDGFYKSPKAYYLPVVIDDAVTLLTPEIEAQYADVVTDKHTIKRYEKKLNEEFVFFRKFEKSLEQLKELMKDQNFSYPTNLFYRVSDFGVKDLASFVEAISSVYSNREALDHWSEVFGRKKSYLSTCTKRYTETKLKESMERIGFVEELKRYDNSFVLVALHHLDESVWFLGENQYLDDKKARVANIKYCLTYDLMEGIGIFFNETRLKEMKIEVRELVDSVYIAHYKKGYLDRFINLDMATYVEDEKHLERLNITLEQQHIHRSIDNIQPHSGHRKTDNLNEMEPEISTAVRKKNNNRI